MKLQITLQSKGGMDLDATNEMTLTWNTDMDDCSIHAWFKVFESVVAAAGFNETVIMKGACELAFNDMRDLQTMKRLAKEYDLTNWDDVPSTTSEGD